MMTGDGSLLTECSDLLRLMPLRKSNESLVNIQARQAQRERSVFVQSESSGDANELCVRGRLPHWTRSTC